MNVHKLKMDTSGNVEDITLVLAKKNGDKISNLTNITDIVAKHCMNDASELSCEAHKKMDNNVLSCWDELVNFKLSWIPEWDMWYEIYVEIDEKDENTKSITAKTIGEAELSQIMLYDIEINTETDIARDDYKIPTKFYNPDHPEASLVDRLMEKAPHYTITHIDKSLMDIQRTFTFDDTSLYDAFKDISEELDCLFVFNSGSGADGKPARTIQIYDLEANCNDCGYRNTYVDTCPKCGSHNVINGYGEYTNIFISKDNLADDITYSVDTDSVKNCFKLEAGDDLMTAAIRACNPNGSDYIYHFSDQVRHEMSPELQTKLKQYDTEYENYQTNKLFTLDSALVSKYNNIVDKYLKYDDTLAKMDNPMHGYPRVMRAYFDTIDMVQFLSNKLMPNIKKPDNSAESQGQYLIDNLPSSASVTSLKTLTVSLAENTIISLARSIVKGSFKITVSDSTLSGNTWRGKINLKGYVNDDDHYTSDYVTIGFDENYQSYVKQRIDTILNKDDTNYYGIVGIFKQDLEVFKSELRKYCLDSLKTFQKCAQGCIDLMVQMGVSAPDTTNNDPNTTDIYNGLYIPYYNKINAVQDEILIRQNEIYAVEGEYNNQGELVTTGIQNEIEKIMSSVQKALDFKSYIGVDLYKEFSSFLRMDKFSNENYTSENLDNTNLFQNALDFINVATKELYKSSTLQHSITGTIKNFLRMKEFEPIMDKFKNGNWITFEVDEKIYHLRIVEYDIDFSDTQNIDVTFSDVVSMPDGMSDLQSVLASATKMATSYSGVLRQSEVNNKFTKKINDMISTGLDMTNTKIISNADHQDITWDEHGLLCREYNDILSDYNPSQLKIINQGVYLTTDNWRTAKAGIGKFWYYDPRDKSYKESYGVIADTLVSNLILTSEVGIYNEENSIEMAKNGIVITTNTNGRNAFTIRKEITDEKGNKSYERQLYIDDNGNIRLAGNASIAWDSITGTENVVVKDTLNEFMATVKEQIDGKIDTFRQSDDPSVNWTDEEKKAHENDLWYDTTNNVVKMWNGSSWDDFTGDVPESVWNEINCKAQIFTDTPKTPYNKGDLWFVGSSGDILTCVTARKESEQYNSSDWTKQNKYTDDTTANEVKTDLKNLSSVLGYNGTTITGTYIYSPHIIGGELAIGDTNGIHASITTDGKLTATGVEISGTITATSGTFTGTVNATSGTFTNVDIQSGNIGGLRLSSNSITSSNENFSVTSGGKLTAKDADISGNINATSLTLGSGVKIDYSKIDNAPEIPDTTTFYKIGNALTINPTGSTSSFTVDSDGLLTAHNAVIFGTIHASNGDIGGFNIVTTKDDSIHAYANTLYSQATDSSGNIYQTGIKGDSANNDATEAAFYVRKKTTSMSDWSQSDVPFYVRKNGQMFCSDITLGETVNMIDRDNTNNKYLILGINQDNGNPRLGVGLLTLGSKTLYYQNQIRFLGRDYSKTAFIMNVPTSGSCDMIPGSGYSSYNLGSKNNPITNLYVTNINGTAYSGGSSGGGTSGEIGQDYTGGTGITVSNGKISMTGTIKRNDGSRYVDDPINGSFHITINHGWNFVDENNTEVTGSYYNGTTVIFSSQDKPALYRGTSIQIGESGYTGSIKMPTVYGTGSGIKYITIDANGTLGATSNGGSGENDYVTAVSVSNNTVYYTKNGYTYNAGSISSSGSGTTYSAGDGITISGGTISVTSGTYAAYSHTHNKLEHNSDSLILTGTNPWFGCESTGQSGDINLGHAEHKWKNIYYSGGFNGGSDEYIKDDIKSINSILSIDKFYMSLNPIQYKFKQRPNDDEIPKIHFGFGARETERHLKENNFVSENYSMITKTILNKPNFVGKTDEYLMNYLEFISLNTHMTQKAHHRIDTLTQENQKLKNTILSLQGEIAIIKQKLEELI